MEGDCKEAVLLASQPIFDRDDRVHGVELLYRNDRQQGALDVGERQATTELLYHLCAGITRQIEHYRSPAFINVSADFLLSRRFLPISADQVVIELVERIVPTPELIDCIAYWHRKGFRFALDDFDFSPSWAPLLRFASIIKVDVAKTRLAKALTYREALKERGLLWLAEGVEDQATRDAFHRAGFDLFQGYFFARPSLVYGRRLDLSALQLARLIEALYQDEPDVGELARTIAGDPNLAIKLVKLANSPFYRTRKKLDSLTQVITRLGLNHLRRWVVFFCVFENSSVANTHLVLVRAKSCELWAQGHGSGIDPSQAFLAGLLSGVEILLGIDGYSFVEQLHVNDAIKAAVLRHEGLLGESVSRVIEVERRISLKQGLDELDTGLLGIYQQAGESVSAILSHQS